MATNLMKLMADRERVRDRRIEHALPLVTPARMFEELPLDQGLVDTVLRGRSEVAAILDREDDRLLVVVGPCSVHDIDAALDYAGRLSAKAAELSDDVCLAMRVYFEKPRTTVGWKGLINDPRLDGSFAINEGLRAARHLLVDLAALGLPVGCEFLDPISPQFTSDTVSWGASSARTTKNPGHRELASGLSMPIGFKNGTDGGIHIAIDAVRSAAHPHRFLGVTEQGLCAIVATRGNGDCHVILRGGESGPNYGAPFVQKTASALRAAGATPRLMIDTSHGNSGKDYRRQPAVAHDIAAQLGEGEAAIFGVMMESFLVEGRQDLSAALRYGQSVTDACLGWEATVSVVAALAEAVRARRTAAGAP
jgi:3-deoxy-7-phosphoheptulonate synthase